MKINGFCLEQPELDASVQIHGLPDGFVVLQLPTVGDGKTLHRHLARAMFGEAAGPDWLSSLRGQITFATAAWNERTSTRTDGPAALRMHGVPASDLPELALWFAVSFGDRNAWTLDDASNHRRAANSVGLPITDPAGPCRHRTASLPDSGRDNAMSFGTPAIEQLLRKRDELTAWLERHGQSHRQQTARTQAELSDVQTQANEVRDRFSAARAELAESERRLRELEVETRTPTLAPGSDEAVRNWRSWRGGLVEQWDRELAHAHQRLAEIERRLEDIGNQLSAQPAHGLSTPEAIETHRGCLASLEQLLAETQAEVDRWENPATCPHCLGEETYTRLTPLVRALRQRIYVMCGLLSDQQRAWQSEWLESERRQLREERQRWQNRLELLEQRRETALRQTPDAERFAAHRDDAFCGCAGHEHHLRDTAARTNSERLVEALSAARSRHDFLKQQCGELAHEQRALHDRRDALQQELAAVVNSEDSLAKQRELLSVQERLAAAFARDERPSARTLEASQGSRSSRWLTVDAIRNSVSAYLRRLTDGAFHAIEFRPGSDSLVVRTGFGTIRNLAELSDAERWLTRLAISLAITDEYHRRGIGLPLLIDASGAQLERQYLESLGRVLAERGLAGRQTLLFVSDPSAADNLRAIGLAVRSLNGFAKAANRAVNLATLPPEPVVNVVATTEAKPPRPPVSKPVSKPASAPNETPQVPRSPAVEKVLRKRPLYPHSPIEHLGLRDRNAVNALRAAGIHRVEQLLAATSEELAARTDDASVTARRIYQWRSCAALRCFLEELEANDAALLVACGIDDPETLADADLEQLYTRVKNYLESDEGVKFARNRAGFSRSQASRWIDAARGVRDQWQTSGWDRTSIGRAFTGESPAERQRRSLRTERQVTERQAVERQTAERGRAARETPVPEPPTLRLHESPAEDEAAHSSRTRSSRDGDASRSMRRPGRRKSGGERRRTEAEEQRPSRSIQQREQARDNDGQPLGSRSLDDQSRPTSAATASRESAAPRGDSSHVDSFRFYLEPNSPVVDAPSIGPKMASRLKRIGITTVTDLLRANAASAVKRLDHDRTNVDLFTAWQRQARLMCRVPQLRGHDAQILVACEIFEAEELAMRQPASLLARVEEFLATKEGERVLRGGRRPDLAEVTDWITWAASNRQLDAA